MHFLIRDNKLSDLNTFIGPLMLDVLGFGLTEEEAIMLSNPLVGGIILFSRNFKSPEQLRGLISEIRHASTNIIIAVDHEGGRVQRFKDGFTVVPAMATLGGLYIDKPAEALSLAKDYGWLIASELISFDIDLSFAPVLDKNIGISSVIGDRAFSGSVEVITDLARSFIGGLHQAGMVSTGKHFPGHGGVKADSHHDIPVDSRSLNELRQDDMKVFSALIDSSLDASLNAVMPAHVIYPEVDQHPACFSKVWLQDILRKDLGFKGVIFSDDLSMEGASVAGGFVARAKAALSAGCDMILVCNQPEGAKQVLGYLEQQKEFDFNNERLLKMRYQQDKKLNQTTLQNDPRWIKLQRPH